MSGLRVLKVKTRYYRTYCGQGIWIKVYLTLPPEDIEASHDPYNHLRALTVRWIEQMYVTNLDDFQAYSKGLTMKGERAESGFTRLVFDQAPGTPNFDDVYAKGFTENVNTMDYLRRADAYRYEMPVTVNAATIGAISELEKMVGQDFTQVGVGWASDEIARFLGVLNAFWD